MAGLVRIARADEVAPGQGKRVEIQGRPIALFNLGGKFYAVDDTCPHRGGPLSEGEVEGEVVTCPWHGATFRIPSGEVLSPPARSGVSTYPVRMIGTDIEVEV